MNPLRNALDWDEISGRGDPRQRYRLYRVCADDSSPQLVATCATEGAVGMALCTLGREGEWADCLVGVLDTLGEPGKRWLVRPWVPSPRNRSDAGRLLGSHRRSEFPDDLNL